MVLILESEQFDLLGLTIKGVPDFARQRFWGLDMGA